MTRIEQRIHTAVLDEIGEQSPEQVIERLLELGLLHPARCEAHAIRREIQRLTAKGLGRCEAMEIAAHTFCCSYEKVRSAVYNIRKY